MKFFKRKKTTTAVFFLALVGVGLTVAMPTHAGLVSDFVQEVLFLIIITPFAQLLNLMTWILLQVTSYNSFASEPIVIRGWEVLRDLANMFFVLIMLIIAIGTIVKWQKINYRSNLRRLILMALLINFSKTIVVFMVDFSQVITLTFITAVRDALQAGIIELLQLDDVIANLGAGISIVTFVVATIMVVVATIVVTAYVIIFVARIISIWMLIIFAPIAFLASTLPQTEKYYDQWWQLLGRNLAIAPILSFLLWLTFAVVSSPGTGGVGNVEFLDYFDGFPVIGGIDGTAIINYIVGMGILTYSIKLAVSMSSIGGNIASGVAGYGLGRLTAGAKYVGFGKSGQGGVLGRVKSGTLKTLNTTARRVNLADKGLALPQADQNAGRVVKGVTSVGNFIGRAGAAVGLGRAARRVQRVTSVYSKRQDRIREKGEADYIRDLSEEEIEDYSTGRSVLQTVGTLGVSGGDRASGPLKKVLERRKKRSVAKYVSDAEALESDERDQLTDSYGNTVASRRADIDRLNEENRQHIASGGNVNDEVYKANKERIKEYEKEVNKLGEVISKLDTEKALELTYSFNGQDRAAIPLRRIIEDAKGKDIEKILKHANSGDPEHAIYRRRLLDPNQNELHTLSQAGAKKFYTESEVTDDSRKQFVRTLLRRSNIAPGANAQQRAAGEQAQRLALSIADGTATKADFDLDLQGTSIPQPDKENIRKVQRTRKVDTLQVASAPLIETVRRDYTPNPANPSPPNVFGPDGGGADWKVLSVSEPTPDKGPMVKMRKADGTEAEIPLTQFTNLNG